MGDRATIIFYDRVQVSPVVYLHWHGRRVPEWLAELRDLMTARRGDAAYAAARFVGICHRHIAGPLSLGIRSTGLQLADLKRPAMLDAQNPGDAGVVLVSTDDFTWNAYGGYLAQPDSNSSTLNTTHTERSTTP